MMENSDAASTETQLLGILVVYCEDGVRKEVWLNIDSVQALAWGEGEVGKRKANPNSGNKKLPEGSAPGECPDVNMAAATPICWWTGSAWVCGTA